MLRKLPQLALLSTRVFLRLVLLALPFLAAAGAVWFATLRGHDINYYLAEEPPEWKRARLTAMALAGAYALVAAWQLARWLYAVPLLVIEGLRPNAALTASARMTRKRVPGIVAPLALWWLAITGVAIAITWACRQVTDGALDWAGIDVHRVPAARRTVPRSDDNRQLPVWRPASRRASVPCHPDVRRATRP